MLPHYLSIGVSKGDFFSSTPKILKAYDKAHEEKIKTMDALAWQFCGSYVLSAVSVAVDHCLNGNKASSSFLRRSIMSNINNEEKTSSDNEEIAVFEMKRRTHLLEKSGLSDSPK